MEKLGFIGVGMMGKPMAKNLLKAGYELTVLDLNSAAVDELVSQGAVRAERAAEGAGGCPALLRLNMLFAAKVGCCLRLTPNISLLI